MLSLTISLLGAASQTADLDRRYWTTFVELAGWLCLAIASVTAVLRLEWFAPEQELEAKKARAMENIFIIEEGLKEGADHVLRASTGEKESPDIALKKHRKAVGTTDAGLARINLRLGFRYLVFRWFLLAGFSCILFARGAVVFVRC